jgi:dTDP-4-amino-4,6-dideoxygalactose transaminase
MKTSVNELAILNGIPAFRENLHVGNPNIGSRDRFMERISDILDRRWLTNNGLYVQKLEESIAAMIGVKHCIAISNGTAALEIATRALGITGEVIMPSFTFVATAHSLFWQEITPVFCDVDPSTHNIITDQVEQMITPKTSAIIGVHIWGRPCNIEGLTQITDRHNLKLLFDAAQAFGCSYKKRMIGNFGIAEVFSFHATKFFNTCEGGAIVTNDDELASKIRLMKNFGFAGYDNVIYIGTNGKMDELSAAMGITNLESIDEFITVNRNNYVQYTEELSDIQGVQIMKYDETEKCNYQYIVLEIDHDVAGLSRDQMVKILHAENVLARRYFYPGCHRMEPYRSFFPHSWFLLPNTERLVKRVMSLPTGTSIGSEEISNICQIIRLAVSNSAELQKRLGE